VYTRVRASARVQRHCLRQRIALNILVNVSRLKRFQDKESEGAEATKGGATAAHGMGDTGREKKREEGRGEREERTRGQHTIEHLHT